MVGNSKSFRETLLLVDKVAASTASILIRGESGSGKELIAQLIHKASNRSRSLFIAINCSAIPENLLESELFGHSRGAFTGAIDKKIGLFEEAEGGTIFLDEIGDMSIALQAKLLRVLQERKIKRIGENHFRNINIRVIAATHIDLEFEISQKRFREDLFFRLNVVPIYLPPLRDRPEDILPLAEAFLKRFALENNLPQKFLSEEAKTYLLTNSWRGNIRELANIIERGFILSSSDEINKSDFLPVTGSLKLQSMANQGPMQNSDDFFSISVSDGLIQLEDVIQKYVEFSVKKNCGARDRTAKEIGIDRKTLYKRLKFVTNLHVVDS